MDDGDLDDDMQEAPLQLAIKTKYVQFMGSNHKFGMPKIVQVLSGTC